MAAGSNALQICANGAEADGVYFANTFNVSQVRAKVVNVRLKYRENSIRFLNSEGLAPDIFQIQICAS